MANNKINRTPMRNQDPIERGHNFKEVALGFSKEEAALEASRCLQCKKPQCVEGCPVSVPIPQFIKAITEGKPLEAAQTIKTANMLPAVCGRVCPQETQCEQRCVLAKKGEAVAIGSLERFVADYERENASDKNAISIEPNGKKVAIVGSGPSGLACAGDLARLGYDVTVFEAFHEPGGVLMYGIPEFRLPKEIVRKEIDGLKKMGVKFELNSVIGRSLLLDDIMEEEGFDAAFVAVGAGLPKFLGIAGENLGNIFSANEYLTRSNLMKAYDFPNYDTPVAIGKEVCVLGGGNVAMDAARTALRLGADKVYIVYRRGRDELPARAEEVHHAEEEGIIFKLLSNPVEFIGDDNGCVAKLKCQRMELGEPDEKGRRRPVPVTNDFFEIPCDAVVISIGSDANPILTKSGSGLELNKWGYIVTDDNGKTSRANVWAGGDIVTGAATVILAMGAGRKAAKDIHTSLSK
ncbi:MAG: NADPH-dependent glutamate synthase [Alphaproteobacteria bacterium]